MSYLHISKNYRRILALGFLLTFFSGFGQSFFISVFTPHFLETLKLTQVDFGFIYSGATLASGLLLPWIGSRLDNVDATRFTLVALTAFAAACLLMASMQTLWTFALALFGLRLCGQGLFSHISATVIARGFLSYRGRALSLTGLGHPASEALLPLLAVSLVNLMDWRWAWVSFGGVLLFLFLPLVPYLIKGRIETAPFTPEAQKSPFFFRNKMPQFAKSWLFWFLAGGTVLPGSILTGLFLYHGFLAQERGWSMTWMATGFMAFAASQIIFSLIGGTALDKFGARKLFSFYLLPLAAGLGVLSIQSSQLWLVPAYLGLSGVTAGLGSPIKTALWTEIYGLRQIATIRSWVGAIAVAGTAASPPLLGFVLDAGYGFSVFLRVSAVGVVLYCLLCLLNMRSGSILRS